MQRLPDEGPAYDERLFSELAHEGRGLCLFRLGRHEEAAAAYAAAGQSAPDDPAYPVKRKLALARARRQREALSRPDVRDGYVLILTPVKNASAYLDTYFAALSKLSYPPELISLASSRATRVMTRTNLSLGKPPGFPGSTGEWAPGSGISGSRSPRAH